MSLEIENQVFSGLPVQQIKKLIYFNTNYRTERKLVPIIMDYCLLQFDALKFS